MKIEGWTNIITTTTTTTTTRVIIIIIIIIIIINHTIKTTQHSKLTPLSSNYTLHLSVYKVIYKYQLEHVQGDSSDLKLEKQ
jgi:hypothetical protein